MSAYSAEVNYGLLLDSVAETAQVMDVLRPTSVQVCRDTFGLRAIEAVAIADHAEVYGPIIGKAIASVSLMMQGQENVGNLSGSQKFGPRMVARRVARPTKFHRETADFELKELRRELRTMSGDYPADFEASVSDILDYDGALKEEADLWLGDNGLSQDPLPYTRWINRHWSDDSADKSRLRLIRANKRQITELQGSEEVQQGIAESKRRWMERTEELVDEGVFHPSIIKRHKRLAKTGVFVGDDFSIHLSGRGGYARSDRNLVAVGKSILVNPNGSNYQRTVLPHEYYHIAGNGRDTRMAQLAMHVTSLDNNFAYEALTQIGAEVIELGVDPGVVDQQTHAYLAYKGIINWIVTTAQSRGVDISPKRLLYADTAPNEDRVKASRVIDKDLEGALGISRDGSSTFKAVQVSLNAYVERFKTANASEARLGSVRDQGAKVILSRLIEYGRLPVNWN